MPKPQIGGYEFNQEITRIRNAADEINNSLNIILKPRDNPVGLQTIYAHLALIAVQVGTILNAATNLERIGRNTKNDRTGQ